MPEVDRRVGRDEMPTVQLMDQQHSLPEERGMIKTALGFSLQPGTSGADFDAWYYAAPALLVWSLIQPDRLREALS